MNHIWTFLFFNATVNGIISGILFGKLIIFIRHRIRRAQEKRIEKIVTQQVDDICDVLKNHEKVINRNCKHIDAMPGIIKELIKAEGELQTITMRKYVNEKIGHLKKQSKVTNQI